VLPAPLALIASRTSAFSLDVERSKVESSRPSGVRSTLAGLDSGSTGRDGEPETKSCVTATAKHSELSNGGICFEMPEVSASVIVDRSADNGNTGESGGKVGPTPESV
jgi:hypothetical protein